MCKILDKIEARGGQNEKHNTIIRSYDNGITDLSLIARIAGVAVDFVKNVLSEAGRISPSV